MVEKRAPDTPLTDGASLEVRSTPLSATLEAILVGLLIVLTIVCYGNMLTNSFVYDDQQQILQNPYIKSWKFLPEIFSSTVWSFVGEAGATNYYRPLMTLSFLVLWTIFGPIPFGFHLFSLILHIAVVLMVFYAGRQLFKNWRVAWLAAILFAVHPVHTEAVDWIASFPDLLMALFFLIAFYAYGRWTTLNWKRWVLLTTIFVLALLSKEPALMLVPVIIIFEHVVRANDEPIELYKKALRYWPFLVIATLYLGLRIALFGKLAPVLQHGQISWPQAIYSGFALVFKYLKLLIWPSSLSAFHVFQVTGSIFDFEALAGVVVVIGVLVCFLFTRKRRPLIAFCLFWMVITLLPVLNARWMAANVMTERYLYLPSVAFCWLVAWCGIEIVDSLRTSRVSFAKIAIPALIIGMVVVCFLGVTETIARNRDWRSDHALYSRTLLTDPHAYPIRLNFALLYQQDRNPKDAESEYKLALKERPDGVNALNNLGVLYFEQQRFPEAAQMLTQAIAVKPRWADPHFNYGRLLDRQGDHDGALKEFLLATQLAPLSSVAHLFYADSLFSGGNLKEATSEYERSLSLDPSLDAERGLSEAYIQMGNHDAAEVLLRRMIIESPYDGSSHLSMARLLERDGKLEEARAEYGKVLETDPHNREAQSGVERLEKPDREPKS